MLKLILMFFLLFQCKPDSFEQPISGGEGVEGEPINTPPPASDPVDDGQLDYDDGKDSGSQNQNQNQNQYEEEPVEDCPKDDPYCNEVTDNSDCPKDDPYCNDTTQNESDPTQNQNDYINNNETDDEEYGYGIVL